MSTTIIARRTKRQTANRVRIIASIVVCALFIAPVVFMVLTSFKLPRDIFTVPPTFFAEFTLQNYEKLNTYDIPRKMLNTALVAVGAGFLSVVVGAMAGYALSRLRIKGGGLIGSLILATRGVPPIALAVPMFLVARNLNVTDLHMTLVIAYASFLVPYVMWLMRSFYVALPKELEESAMVDGASRLGTFFRIILPIVAPSLVSTLIFAVMMAWEELLFALILTSRDATTIPVAIQSMAVDVESGGMWGMLTAAGTLSVLPIILFVLLCQRWLIQGMAEGATKG
ncbi:MULTISPECIES: carbohydrate ABC transporter permease [unclassified Salinibacterium]|uniref:carbohydrate ABC transporter permease n=1 Tax=unclassified Salinibacterium TaxID=2632331 RepID=UPI001AB044F9|nr:MULTISPECIES: carbohydrate ABC transporter permease [unclassified Salinibacterium]